MGNSDFLIRLAEQSDFDEVSALWHQSASVPGVGPPSMPSEDDLRRRLWRSAEQEWRLLIAVAGAEVIGMLALKMEQGILDQLFIRPSHFGTGLGTALLDRAKAELPLGFSLHTASTNARARKFYEREGMEFLREGRHPRTGHPVSYYEWAPRQHSTTWEGTLR